MEVQLVPPPALEFTTRSGRKHYPASHYWKLEDRTYMFRLGGRTVLYWYDDVDMQVDTGRAVRTYRAGTNKYRARVAFFRALEDNPPFYTNIKTWEDWIKSMPYLYKIKERGGELNPTQQKQWDLVKKYAPI